ncbi:MAG TPA: hypothetical protein VGP79_10730 [Bryobacteraceae bacterium]|jgi:hypothetical protein|nr:hypothetical protein [Bryobacteraceae bacterium]
MRLGVVLFSLALLSGIASAQPSRDGYRTAYRNWKQADPNLERDAVAGGASIATRADAMAAGALSFVEAHRDFLTAWGDELAQKALSLEDVTAVGGVESSKAVVKTGLEVVAAQTTSVGRMIDTFAGDSDPGMQQLRQALEAERAALAALTQAIGARQKAVSSAATSAAALEAARAKAAEPYRKIATAVQESAAATEKQSVALAAYYKKLTEAATRTGPASVSSSAPGPTENSSSPITAPGPTRPVDRDPVRPSDSPRTPSITPVPMVRYTGAWIFPAGGAFVGPQPEFLDLVVHETNGQCTGTLFARFKLPAGSTGDPVLRFDFSGEFKSTMRQTFTLLTSDGANGTIELIPGSAFNLLEVNFTTDPRPGKVRQANVVLVKK